LHPDLRARRGREGGWMKVIDPGRARTEQTPSLLLPVVDTRHRRVLYPRQWAVLKKKKMQGGT
jgi:hypothetical protein